MNLYMFRPRNETEISLLSISENCEKLLKQIHRKPQETLNFRLTKPKETFSYKKSNIFGPNSKWIYALTNLEAHTSVFNVTEEKTVF